MNQRKRKGIVWLLVFAMLIGNILPSGTGITFAKGKSGVGKKSLAAESGLDNLANPRRVPESNMWAGQKVTWDCVWFGSYPQAEVIPASEEYTVLDKKLLQAGDLIKDDALFQKLEQTTNWDKQGDVEIDGEKYRRIKKEDAIDIGTSSSYYQWENAIGYHYFKYQPIKWRVLSVDGFEVFLLADKVLDDKQYHTVLQDVTWEDSTIRSWLNGYGVSANKQNKDYGKNNFIDTAFSEIEQVAIQETKVKNMDNQSFGTMGGNDTLDKVFLLSESEVYTDAAKDYGFVSHDRILDEARRAKSSVYAKAMGVYSQCFESVVGNCIWWLRSPDSISSYAMDVGTEGWKSGYNSSVDTGIYGVRPALNLTFAAWTHINTSNFCSYAGTVCSDGTMDEKKPPEKTEDSLSNPRIVPDSSMEAGQKVTWDCVWFGSYPQAEVVPASEEYTALDKKFLQEGDLIQDDELYQKLKSATDWDKQGDVEIDGEKYRRIKKEDATYVDTDDLVNSYYSNFPHQ